MRPKIMQQSPRKIAYLGGYIRHWNQPGEFRKPASGRRPYFWLIIPITQRDTPRLRPRPRKRVRQGILKNQYASLEQLQVQWEQVGARRCHPQYLCQCWKLHGKEQDEINAAGSITERRVQPLTCSAHFLRSGKLAGQVQFKGSPACGH